MESILDFSIDLAKRTGQLLQDRFKIDGTQVTLKKDRSVVTEADRAADRLIRTVIHENFPEDGILSEEDQTTYPRDKDQVWIIDPLDGTTNYSLGLHYWGVSIARVRQGIPQLAVLNFPLLGEFYTAIKDKGAFLNGNRLVARSPQSPNHSTYFSCCSRTHQYYQVQVKYKTRILGSAVFSLVSIARGNAILAFESTPKVWDLSGAWLVLQEAGGEIGPISGPPLFPLIPGKDYVDASYATLAAATPELWAWGKEHIRKK
jgi:myo-inositol-1(or 4)-monophosphatase